MARNKQLLMKEIKGALEQAQHILVTPVEDLTYQEIQSAASSAAQAAAQLYRLAGQVDAEDDCTC